MDFSEQGSLGHWQQDADTFASWGVDYVKIDYCGKGTDPSGHHNMSKAMNATGRPMVLALCRGPYLLRGVMNSTIQVEFK